MDIVIEIKLTVSKYYSYQFVVEGLYYKVSVAEVREIKMKLIV